MHSLLWTTGALVWCAISLIALWLFLEAILAMANAASFLRWRYRTARVHGGKLRWAHLPGSFLIQTGRLVFHRNDGPGGSAYGDKHGGRWCGIGDWSVGHVAVHAEDK